MRYILILLILISFETPLFAQVEIKPIEIKTKVASPKGQVIESEDSKKRIPIVQLEKTQLNYQLIQQRIESVYRMASQQPSTRSFSSAQLEELARLSAELKKDKQIDCATNLYLYLSNEMDLNQFELLKKAYQQNPNDERVLKHLFLGYTAINDMDSATIFLKKLNALSPVDGFLKNYLTDILKSVPPGGILITHGIDDFVQIEQIRLSKPEFKEIPIVSFELMRHSTYIKQLENRGYELPNSKELNTNYLMKFCSLNAQRNLFLSSTFPLPYLEEFNNSEFISGILFASKDAGSNYDKLNSALFENTIRKNLKSELSKSKPSVYVKNYIPFLVNQYWMYDFQKQTKEKSEVESLIKLLAKKMFPELDYHKLIHVEVQH